MARFKEGFFFFCVKGVVSAGTNFIQDAINFLLTWGIIFLDVNVGAAFGLTRFSGEIYFGEVPLSF
jgi:large-conductance mechanosensitive channel